MTDQPKAQIDLNPDAAKVPMAVWIVGVVTVLAVVLGVFQLYTAGWRPLNLFYQRGFHLMVVLVIAFLAFPFRGRKRGVGGWLVDGDGLAASLHLARDTVIALAR